MKRTRKPMKMLSGDLTVEVRRFILRAELAAIDGEIAVLKRHLRQEEAKERRLHRAYVWQRLGGRHRTR